MPAETTQHVDPLSARDVIALLSAVVASEVDSSTSVIELAMHDQVDVLALWDAAVEKFAERTLGAPDLTELFELSTAGELATATLRCLQPSARRHE